MHDAHECDAVLVAPGLFVKVASDHHLSKVVVDAAKRKGLLGALFGIGNRIRGLDVDALVSLIDDKVDFILPDFMLPGRAGFKLDYADIYRISTPNQLVVDDVLHEVRLFVLSKVDLSRKLQAEFFAVPCCAHLPGSVSDAGGRVEGG